jgi:hypothetical protein
LTQAQAAQAGAEAAAAGISSPYETRADFIAAQIPPVVTRSSFFVNGNTYAVVRDASGPIVQANGQRWRQDDAGRQYVTRAAFVADLDAGYDPAAGTVISAGGLQYVRTTGATALPGLPGWLPFGRAFPAHYDITGDVLIPTHFATLQEAFDTFGPNRPDSIVYRIVAGHLLTAGLSLVGGDYSKHRITADDAIVTLAAGFQFVTSSNAVISFAECKAPVYDCLIDQGGEGGRGIMYLSAQGKVGQQKGLINAGLDCLYMNSGSIVNAFRTTWDGGGNLCAWVSRVSFLDAEESSFCNSGNVGITVRRSSRANITNSKVNDNANAGVSLTRSQLTFQGRETGFGPSSAECNNNGSNGVSVARGSVAILTGLTADNNTGNGVNVFGGSMVDFDFGFARGNSTAGINATGGAKVSAAEADLSGNGRGIIANGAATEVDARSANLNNATTNAIQSLNGARVSAPSATGNNAGANAIECRDGAAVSINGATFDDAVGFGLLCDNATAFMKSANIRRSGGTHCVRSTSGSVYAQSSNARKVDGIDGTSDFAVSNGGIIHANGATGGTNIAANTVTASGLIFK